MLEVFQFDAERIGTFDWSSLLLDSPSTKSKCRHSTAADIGSVLHDASVPPPFLFAWKDTKVFATRGALLGRFGSGCQDTWHIPGKLCYEYTQEKEWMDRKARMDRCSGWGDVRLGHLP